MRFKPSKFVELSIANQTQNDSIKLRSLAFTGLVTTVVDNIVNPSLISSITLGLSVLGIVTVIWRKELNRVLNHVVRLTTLYRVTSPILTILGTFVFLDALSMSAQAQFFQNAETWMSGQFTGANEAITLAFNVLRGLFILYLGISLVRVIQAARNDEDWVNLARTPMIILITVTMGDILANLIIGGGGTNVGQ
ncbi:MAG: hypothetical protein ACFB02_16085 [Mastigocoleus sp.]